MTENAYNLWEDAGYSSEEAVIGNGIVKMRVRPIRGVDPVRWVYDCNDTTSPPVYTNIEDAKSACIGHAQRCLNQALATIRGTHQ